MSFSTRCMRDQDWRLLNHFTKGEFKHPEKMGYEFMLKLDELRAKVAMPMVITSSYRDPAYNRAVGGAKDSAHTDVPCESVDIGRRPRGDDPNWNATRYRILKCALQLGWSRIGMYQNGSMHLDLSDTRPRDRCWVAVDNPAR